MHEQRSVILLLPTRNHTNHMTLYRPILLPYSLMLTFCAVGSRVRHGLDPSTGPDEKPDRALFGKNVGPRPHINFLTLMHKTFGRYMWTVRNIAAVIWIESGDTAFCIRKLYV